MSNAEVKPLLSICIPTYNRSKYLKKCLDSIVSQFDFNIRNVEVIISDNASTDDTEMIALEYTKRYENVFYYKNKENVRDINFPLVLSKANGIYRKLSNDTQLFKKGSLAFFLKAIQENIEERPLLFFLNGMISMKCDDIRTSGFNDFLYHVSFYVTWTALFGIWENDCKDILDDISDCDLQLWQVGSCLKMLHLHKNQVIFSKKFCNMQRVKNKNLSYGLFDIFYNNYLTILGRFYTNNILSDSCFSWLRKDLFYNFFTNWIIEEELQKGSFIFSSDEELKAKLWSKYEMEDYFYSYQIYYTKKLRKRKNQYLIKRIFFIDYLIHKI